jgi:hypothetical protein
VSAAAPVCYYIYYRVAAEQAPAARRAIGGVLSAVEQRTGVMGRLLRRRDESLMWMEVYDDVGDPRTFEETLASVLADHDFSSFLAPGSDRRIERFIAAT